MGPETKTNAAIEKEPHSNPYEHSAAVATLKERKAKEQPLRIALLDVDSTLTGTPEDQARVRQLLKEFGYVTGFVTSRVYEMLMSREQRQKSTIDNLRPVPRLKTQQQGSIVIDEIRESGGQFTDAHPDDLASYAGMYDPDIIIDGTGTNVLLQQEEGGYERDTHYQERMKVEGAAWRATVTDAINGINTLMSATGVEGITPAKFAIIDTLTDYAEGRIDVSPPDLRIQLNFDNQASQESFARTMRNLQARAGEVLQKGINTDVASIFDLRITEDGKPEDNRFQVYLAPNQGTKQRGVEEVIKGILEALNDGTTTVNREDLEILFCGDSYPDLPMGLYSALDTKAQLLLVGGSRLVERDEKEGYELKDRITTENLQAIKRRLTKKGKGIFKFKPPGHTERDLIIGDEAYPGTKGPQTIISHLENIHRTPPVPET